MKIKPSDVICTRQDFLKAKEAVLKNMDVKAVSIRSIVLAIKYFSKKYKLVIDEFDEKILLEKMKQSDDFAQVWLATKVEEILWYNSWLDAHYFEALNASSMVLKVSKDWKILWANKSFTEVAWYTLEEVIWLETRQLSWDFSKEKPREFWENLWNTILFWNIWKWKIKNQTKDWTYYRTDTTIIPKMTNWELDYFTVVRTDVTENENLRSDVQKVDELRRTNTHLIAENAKLWILSKTDWLTGLHNRRAFDEKLDEEISRARRTNTDLSLILFDVDHFKKINDTYWHDIWDVTLKLIAEELKSITRDIDFKFRIGWEEFAIILTWESLESTKKIAEKIRLFFENLRMEWLPNFTMSFWISFFNNLNSKLTTKEMFFKKADEALYRAKDAWRNCVRTSTNK